MFTKKTQLFAPNVEANMITNLTPTEIEELRIAIAEECGWNKTDTYTSIQDGSEVSWWRLNKDVCSDCVTKDLPPYTTSLDAIQAAAMERFKIVDEQFRFEYELKEMWMSLEVGHWWQLSALDWCIAFARTAKIWKFKPLNETNPPRV